MILNHCFFFYLVKNRLGKRNLVEVIGLKANMLRRIPSTENWIDMVLSAVVVAVLWLVEARVVQGAQNCDLNYQ